MSLTYFCAFALVYTVLVVRECVHTLGFDGFALLLTTMIWACKRLADVDSLEDIGPEESRCPGTSRFLRQLRQNDVKSRVPRAPVDKTGTVDNDTEDVEPCVPVQETRLVGANTAAAAAVDEGAVVVPTAADEGPLAPAADDDAVIGATAAKGPIAPAPAATANDDAVTGASVVAGPIAPASAADDDDAVTGATAAEGPAVPAATDEGAVVVPVAADKGADNGAEVPLLRTTVGDDAGGDDSEDAAPHSPTNEAWLISNPRADIYSLRIDTSPHIIVSPLFEYADPSDIYEDAGILLKELHAHTGEDESTPIQCIIDDAGAQYDNLSHVCEGLARALDRLANRFQACGIHSEQPAEPVSADSATGQVKSVAHTNNVGTTVPSAGPASTTDTTEGRKARRAGKTKNCAPTKGADGTKTTKSRAEKVGGNRASGSKARANKADGGDKSTSKPPARNDGSASRSKPRADRVSSSEESASRSGAKKAAGNGNSDAKSRAHNSSDRSANARHDSKTEDILTSGSNKVQPKARYNSVPAASSASTEPEVPNASSSSSGVTALAPTDQHEVPVTSAGAATQVPAIPEAIKRVGGPTAVGATSPLVASHASGTRVLFASTPVLPVLPRASASEKGKAPDRSNADTVDTSSSNMPVNYYETTRVRVPEVSSSKWYMKLSKNAGSQFRGRFDTDVAKQDTDSIIADGTKQEAEPLSSTGALHATESAVADAEMEEVEPPVADTETDKEPPTNDLDMKEPPVANVEMDEEPPADDLDTKEPPVADTEMDEADADMEDPPVANAVMEEPPAADADMEEAEAPADGDAEMVEGTATKMEEKVEVHVPVLDSVVVEAGMLILGRPHVQPRKQRPNKASTGTLPINSFGSGAGTLEPNFLYPLAGGNSFNQGYPVAGTLAPNLMYPVAGAPEPNLLYPLAGALNPNPMDPETGGLPFDQGYPQANSAPLAGTAGSTINVPTFTSGLDAMAWINGTSGANAVPSYTLGQAAPGPLPDVSHIDFNALGQGCANAGTGDILLAGNTGTPVGIPFAHNPEAIAIMRDITKLWYTDYVNTGGVVIVDNPGVEQLGGNPGTVPPQPNAGDAQPDGGEFDDFVNAIETNLNNDARNTAKPPATGDTTLYVDSSGTFAYQRFNDPRNAENMPVADAMGNAVPANNLESQNADSSLHFVNSLTDTVRGQYNCQVPQNAPPTVSAVDNTKVGDNSGIGAFPFDITGTSAAGNYLEGGALGPLFLGADATRPPNLVVGDLWQNIAANDLLAELDLLAALPRPTVPNESTADNESRGVKREWASISN